MSTVDLDAPEHRLCSETLARRSETIEALAATAEHRLQECVRLRARVEHLSAALIILTHEVQPGSFAARTIEAALHKGDDR